MRVRFSIRNIAGEHHQADHHRQQPVFLDRGVAEEDGAAQAGRQRQGDLVGAPDHVDQLFGRRSCRPW